MNCDDIAFLSAEELAAAIRAKKISPVEVTAGVLARIEQFNPKLNAYCTLLADDARAAATAAEQAVMRGEKLGPLHGVPVSVKDNLHVRGTRTTLGSKLLEKQISTVDHPAVERLRGAGMILIGRTTTPEFSWKGVTDSPLFGVTRNPWNMKLTPGGSSGGAGAAVAAGLGQIGIGTDGGGSLRIPGSFCGLVGYKPSFGRVANAPASTVDSLRHTGALTRTVGDAALVLRVIAGADERDPASLPSPPADWLATLDDGIKGVRIAYSPDLGYAKVDPEVARQCAAAARRLSDAGAIVEEVSLGWSDPFATWSTLFHGGLTMALVDRLIDNNLAKQLDPGLRKVVEQKKSLTAKQWSDAHLARAAFWQQARAVYEKFDLLATPALASLPFELGQDDAPLMGGRQLGPLQWTQFTYPFNLTGQPAISVPCGWTDAGLPVGLQFVGPRFADLAVLRAARAWEQLAPWRQRCPVMDS